MASWKKPLKYLGQHAEEHFSQLYERLNARFRFDDPVQIVPYLGHGTSDTFYLKGRVLENKGYMKNRDSNSRWRNLLSSYQRFESDEIPGAHVRAHYETATQSATSNKEGYYDIELHPPAPFDREKVWHPVELQLVDADPKDVQSSTGEVLVPPPQAEFGVISDIDDTVLQTGATNFLRMARLTFLHNARTRMPFEGVAAFYTALQRKESVGNPVFYVSSSPWNLYDLLIDFLEYQGIPRGPLFLRDYGMQTIRGSHGAHKTTHIRHLMDTHAKLPFILIGDSGQEDPEIYRDIVHEYPDRISAVYIRDVSQNRREQEIQQLIDECSEKQVEMLLVPNTVEAAQHAAASGFIPADAIPDIEMDKEKDEQEPSALEKTLKQS